MPFRLIYSQAYNNISYLSSTVSNGTRRAGVRAGGSHRWWCGGSWWAGRRISSWLGGG
jgi:hypothetical protein